MVMTRDLEAATVALLRGMRIWKVEMVGLLRDCLWKPLLQSHRARFSLCLNHQSISPLIKVAKLVYQSTKKRAGGPNCPVTGKRIHGMFNVFVSRYTRAKGTFKTLGVCFFISVRSKKPLGPTGNRVEKKEDNRTTLSYVAFANSECLISDAAMNPTNTVFAYLEHPVSEDTLQLLFEVSNSSNLEKSLEILIQDAKSDSGRLELASKRILPAVLNIVPSLTHASHHHHRNHILSLCFKLLRNLCAGEAANQGSFLELNGVAVVCSVLRSEAGSSDPDHGLVRWGLQVLANVSLAGKQHQRAIWEELYPVGFVSLARVGTKETCDPLCIVIYTCCDGNPEWFKKLSSDDGWPVMAEIIRTVSSASFGEDGLKLLLSRICLEESQLPVLFSKLQFVDVPEGEVTESKDDQFSFEQAFLLQILSEILNERLRDVTVSKDVALFVFGIFKKSVGVLEHAMRGKSGLPSGFAGVDILGYSLTLLRDICAQDGMRGNTEDANDVVDVLLSYGIIESLLFLLGALEPPEIIRKGLKQCENQDGASCSSKPCPYKGFRRDIVALIGNCVYRRKHAQDEIRNRNGILLLLQQCVMDEDNPFLREWGIWSVRNMLEGNDENQKVVADLEIQGSVDVPEITALGLRVEVDQRTRRAKLVNVP
ncbi:Ataxin-10 protein [Spatholobus suberectus]|nr:Ataxin-10 protein [Spatholobus suberectus]